MRLRSRGVMWLWTVPFRQGAERGRPGRGARARRCQRPDSPRETEVQGSEEGSSQDWHPSVHREWVELTQPRAEATSRTPPLKEKRDRVCHMTIYFIYWPVSAFMFWDSPTLPPNSRSVVLTAASSLAFTNVSFSSFASSCTGLPSLWSFLRRRL